MSELAKIGLMHPHALAAGIGMNRRAPTADEAAAALVTCCRAFGEDPVRVAQGRMLASLAALHAVSALAPLYKLEYPRLARLCGVPDLTPRALSLAQNGPNWRGCVVRAAQQAALFRAILARQGRR